MQHGGDISDAARQFGRGEDDWLDLSTGIAPESYPLPAIAAAAWQQLPQAGQYDALIEAARAAYGAPADAAVVAAPGTQMLIQLLPLHKPGATVRILGPTYSEHARCWQRTARTVETTTKREDLSDCDVAVITNPNNPNGRLLSPDSVLELATSRAWPDRLTVIDEAFVDLLPQASLAPFTGTRGLLVLRSFGKFYGLAGARLGFAIGHRDDIAALATWLGPWAVPGPAAAVAIAALRDTAWADAARSRYREQAAALDQVLERHGLKVIGGTHLFRLTQHDRAGDIHRRLAEHGILTRVFDDHPQWLRFGLPHPTAIARLNDALARVTAL